MIHYQIQITLLSDTTFGSGDGVAGIIDREIEKDADGMPYLRGHTLKGLLSEEADNLINTISDSSIRENWLKIADDLFGQPGSTLDTQSLMHMGNACLPEGFRRAVSTSVQQQYRLESRVTPTEVLNALTTVRRQTAIGENGIAAEGSLRSFRVILRGQEFFANIQFHQEPKPEVLTLLKVSALALRRAGSSRNRGLGHIQCRLLQNGNDITGNHINTFGQEIKS
jgi:CRISPR/Cas system CSM-associated protein Csm3 (group 7 of RAMP superfamily)